MTGLGAQCHAVVEHKKGTDRYSRRQQLVVPALENLLRRGSATLIFALQKVGIIGFDIAALKPNFTLLHTNRDRE